MKKVLALIVGLFILSIGAPAFATTSDHSQSCTVTHVNLDGGQVKFSVPEGCRLELTLASYSAPSATFDVKTADQQKLIGVKSNTVGAGNYTWNVALAPCFYQVDFVYGSVITNLNEHSLYGDRLIQSANGGTQCQTTTTSTSTTVTTPVTTLPVTTTTVTAPVAAASTPSTSTTLAPPTTLHVEANADDSINRYVPPTTVPVATENLAYTGSNTWRLAGFGILLIGLGYVLVISGRRFVRN